MMKRRRCPCSHDDVSDLTPLFLCVTRNKKGRAVKLDLLEPLPDGLAAPRMSAAALFSYGWQLSALSGSLHRGQGLCGTEEWRRLAEGANFHPRAPVRHRGRGGRLRCLLQLAVFTPEC